MLQTIKSTIVVGTLLIVGYGVHIVLNKPPSGDDPIWNNADEISLPSIEFGQSEQVSPIAESRTTGDPLTPKVETPPVQPMGAPAQDTSYPAAFATPGGGAYPTTGAPTFPPVGDTPAINPAPANTYALPNTTTPSQPPLGQAPPSYSATDPGVGQGATSHPSTGLINSTTTMETGASSIAATSHTESFDDMWDSAQQKLQNGELVGALLNLSILYRDDSLHDFQRDRLITLLDQLAGTVIYSTEHHMAQAHVVAPGDTIESIAAQWQVPTGFLCRVNRITLESPVQPGQPLKVVTGPFRAELAISRRELTLYLGPYYAGRFSVGIGRDLPANSSLLEVCEKSGPRPYFDARTGQSIPAGHPESPYGQYWIGFRSGGQVDPALGIHDTGPSIPASDTRGCVTVSSRDADDLQAILSVGSRIELTR